MTCSPANLPASSRALGVPHYFTVRAILESSGLEEAVQAVSRARRAIPANILLATPQGPADMEVTIDDVHVLQDEGRGFLVHTNHCLHQELKHINQKFPELIQSRPRKARAEELLRRAQTPDSLEQILTDHQEHPRSICRHANDDPVHGFWKTVFSVIIQPDRRLLRLSRGNPCCRPFETYQLRSPDS